MPICIDLLISFKLLHSIPFYVVEKGRKGLLMGILVVFPFFSTTVFPETHFFLFWHMLQIYSEIKYLYVYLNV